MNELERVLMTVSCRDSDPIPKVEGAGRIVVVNGEEQQIMHNGLNVIAGGYYGDWMSHIIRGLNGHHEPQEELIFHHLLKYVRNGTHIVELGAFWAYYTLWYLKEIPRSTATCVEPDINHLNIGMRNSQINSFDDRINFVNAWVGGADEESYTAMVETSNQAISLPMMNMSSIKRITEGVPIELLHMDIQGFELPFIESITSHAKDKLVRFIMVSTHHSCISGSKTTHVDCIDQLQTMGAHIILEHDVIESFSGDGLILASFYEEDKDLLFPNISRNKSKTSLFKQA